MTDKNPKSSLSESVQNLDQELKIQKIPKVSLDFERKYKKHLKSDPSLEFPKDDIKVETISQTYDTVSNNLPAFNKKEKPINSILEVISNFSQPRTIVKYSNRTFFDPKIPIYETKEESFEALNYEIDRESKIKEVTVDLKFYDEKGNEELNEKDYCKPLMTKSTDHNLKTNQEQRRKEEREVFPIFSNTRLSHPVNDPRTIPKCKLGEKVNKQYLVLQPKGLQMPLQHEPFYMSAYLLDLNSQQRLSETYNFTLCSNGSTKETQGLLKNYFQGNEEALQSARKGCIFEIERQVNEINLVVRLEKILVGDYDNSIDPYLKKKKGKKIKNLKDLESKIKDSYSRKKIFRQPVGFTFYSIYDENNDLRIKKNDKQFQEIVCDNWIKTKDEVTDQEIIENIQLVKKGIVKKQKQLPVALKFSLKIITNFNKLNTKILDSSLNLLTTNSNQKNKKKTKKSKKKKQKEKKKKKKKEKDEETETKGEKESYYLQIQNFPLRPLLIPYQKYQNNLYIYPISSTLSGIKGTSARNISVKVEYFSNDKSRETIPLANFYGKYGENKFFLNQFTSSQYHNKHPNFYEEFKLKLPTLIGNEHHLLFTFYHVECKPKKKKKKNKNLRQETTSERNSLEGTQLIGYSILTIFNDKGIISREETIPVHLTLPEENYLSSPQLHLKQEKGKKCLFTVKLKTMSTNYTADPYLNTFFTKYKSKNTSEKVLEDILINLIKSDPIEIIHFFDILMNILFKLLLGNVWTNLRLLILETILNIINIVHNHDSKMPNTVIRRYIYYIFYKIQNDNKAKKKIKKKKKKTKKKKKKKKEQEQEDKYLHEIIVKLWIKLLKNENEEKSFFNIQKNNNISYFLFEMIIKSMALYLNEQKKINAKIKTVGLFEKEFTVNLFVLTNLINKKVHDVGLAIAKNINLSFALFAKDLLSIYNKGIVFQLIKNYLDGFQINNTNNNNNNNYLINVQEFKLLFLMTILDYEYFFKLNFCIKKIKTNISDIFEYFSKKHFLMNLFFEELNYSLKCNQKQNFTMIRTKPISLLRNLIEKHFSQREFHTNKQFQQKVCTIYLPFIIILIENREFVITLELEERRNLFVSFLFILKFLEREFLFNWWQNETHSNKLTFFKLLIDCLFTFRYMGKNKLIELSLNKKKNRSLSGKNQALKLTNLKTSFENDYGSDNYSKVSVQKRKSLLKKNKELIQKSLNNIGDVGIDGNGDGRNNGDGNDFNNSAISKENEKTKKNDNNNNDDDDDDDDDYENKMNNIKKKKKKKSN
ncbi:dedicator of cytokinesis dock [Anaeramoeba flamelloides]|uniref:Dedicator of cytokinesis dock n=1 Tax=Anaeramoeba flamelloides TaxID=1746091 RepID=A0ABQ8XX17_9EUKA|nr:dedicator of cytokinesis dock [Anaeramoeba flamelloides]